MFNLRTNALRTSLGRVFPFLALSTLCFVSSCRKPTPTLSLLVWEGYADSSFIQGFEATCHCKVVAAYMGSSDELVAESARRRRLELRRDLALERRSDDAVALGTCRAP